MTRTDTAIVVLCSYDWNKDGKPLGTVSNVLFVGNGTLHISRVTQASEGVYQCFAGNIYGRTMSTLAELRMAVRDTSSPRTNHIAAVEGQSVVINCRRTTKCFPKPHYSWELKSADHGSTHIDMNRRRQVDQQGKILLSVSRLTVHCT